MSHFFKSRKNLKDSCPLIILPKPKPIPFSIASSSGNKVASNFDFNHNNLVMQYDAYIATKLFSFGANGVNVFQWVRNGVIHQMQDKYSQHLEGIHCMAHRTHLIV
jgi:hypothetical protein